MFPTEIQLEQHRKEMHRAAENHRLVRFIREDAAQPSLWQRLRTHLSAAQSGTAVVQNQSSVKQQTEAIA